jgi:hypothetical protein
MRNGERLRPQVCRCMVPRPTLTVTPTAFIVLARAIRARGRVSAVAAGAIDTSACLPLNEQLEFVTREDR